MGVADEHGEARPALAPQPHPAVEAGGPEAEAGDGEAGDAAPALVAQQALLDLGGPRLRRLSGTRLRLHA